MAETTDEPPPWISYIPQGLLIGGCVISLLLGIWVCISEDPLCIAAGILQILTAVFVIALDALNVYAILKRIKLWQRGAVYFVLSLLPMILCPKIGSLIGCGIILFISLFNIFVSIRQTRLGPQQHGSSLA